MSDSQKAEMALFDIKVCTHCKYAKPITAFAPEKRRGPGAFTSWCRRCLKLSRDRKRAEVRTQREQATARRLGEMTEKICPRCGETKPLADFNKNKRLSDGLQTYCRPCCAVLTKASYAKNPRTRANMSPDKIAVINARHKSYYAKNKHLWRERWLRTRYGVTTEWYDEQFAKQGGRCALPSCKNPLPKYLAIDHHEATGIVRELMCNKHNTGIGMFNESMAELMDAVLYVKRHWERGAAGKRTP